MQINNIQNYDNNPSFGIKIKNPKSMPGYIKSYLDTFPLINAIDEKYPKATVKYIASGNFEALEFNLGVKPILRKTKDNIFRVYNYFGDRSSSLRAKLWETDILESVEKKRSELLAQKPQKTSLFGMLCDAFESILGKIF